MWPRSSRPLTKAEVRVFGVCFAVLWALPKARRVLSGAKHRGSPSGSRAALRWCCSRDAHCRRTATGSCPCSIDGELQLLALPLVHWGDYTLSLRPRPNTPGTHRVWKIYAPPRLIHFPLLDRNARADSPHVSPHLLPANRFRRAGNPPHFGFCLPVCYEAELQKKCAGLEPSSQFHPQDAKQRRSFGFWTKGKVALQSIKLRLRARAHPTNRRNLASHNRSPPT